MDSSNPYAPPQVDLLVTDAEASRVRLEHLRTEGHLKALGILFLSLAIAQPAAYMLRMRFLGRMFDVEVALHELPYDQIANSLALLLVGVGLLKLQRWGGLLAVLRAVVMIFNGILNMPSGLGAILIQAVILRLLLSSKVRLVFATDYREIQRLTPNVKSPVARWIRPVLVLQACLFIAMIFFYRGGSS